MRAMLLIMLPVVSGCAVVPYEEPAYEVMKRYEEFELRRYGPQLVAETEVVGEFGQVGNQAFRILAAFISGDNRRQEEIRMTAPVTQTPAAAERIPMTAPVTQAPAAGDDLTYVFQFVMPSRFTRETLPEPLDPRVRIREVPARLMAARRFSGSWRESWYRANESALLRAVEQAGLTPVSEPEFARYNSPFTLWFLRRNEVLVEVKAPGHRTP